MHDHEYRTCGICDQRYEDGFGHTCFDQYPESTAKLLTELSASEAPKWIIDAAKSGLYNDYDSPLATPCHQLAWDAEKAHLPLIVKRAKDGAYDGTKAESEAWMAKEGNKLLTPEQLKALGFNP